MSATDSRSDALSENTDSAGALITVKLTGVHLAADARSRRVPAEHERTAFWLFPLAAFRSSPLFPDCPPWAADLRTVSPGAVPSLC
jgi:hypothetical protein